ncbi:hypothetical protein TNCV_2222661 [Trichonephila clavipes]|nr:hypothetical protein TNCV_2222661 [Trichonephila clavipes]
MFDDVKILYYFLGFFDGGRKLEHSVAKLMVVTAIVGFSHTWSATEEKRTGDDKKVMEAEESIHCILNRLWYPGVEMDHFSNSIFSTAVCGQIDSYGDDDSSSFVVTRCSSENHQPVSSFSYHPSQLQQPDVFSNDMYIAFGVPSNSP